MSKHLKLSLDIDQEIARKATTQLGEKAWRKRTVFCKPFCFANLLQSKEHHRQACTWLDPDT